MLFADGVALDSSGNLYIADGYNRIRKVTPLTATTGTITTYVGNGTTCAVPTATPYAISTIAGTGTAGYTGDSGAAISAELSYPYGIAVDSSSNLYIADTGNNVIRKVVLSSGIITTVAGNGTTGYSGDGGAAISAQLNFPTGVAVDASGNIYVADYNNQAIREVTVSNNIINTVAGNGTWGYSGDGGPSTNALLNGPRGVFVNAAGNIYIADTWNQAIREVIVSSGLITTIAGNGMQGYSGDDGPATDAQLYLPWGVALDAANNVYIADTTNGRIRAVGAVQITPAINWAPPAPIVYGTTLASTLSASSAVPGTFTYSYLVGTTVTPVTTTTVLHPGTYAITATFNPTDAVDYATNSITVNLTVYPATPIATWITTTHVYGTPLGPNPNLVNFNVAGTITYQPASALTSTLDAGTYVLTAAFTPTDTVDYTTASSEAPITITATTTTYDSGTVTLTVNGSTAASYVYGAGTHGATETPSTVAAGLAAANSSSLVTLTAVDDTPSRYLTPAASPTALSPPRPPPAPSMVVPPQPPTALQRPFTPSPTPSTIQSETLSAIMISSWAIGPTVTTPSTGLSRPRRPPRRPCPSPRPTPAIRSAGAMIPSAIAPRRASSPPPAPRCPRNLGKPPSITPPIDLPASNTITPAMLTSIPPPPTNTSTTPKAASAPSPPRLSPA